MKYDAIVIGGGHNGLVTACYLARAKWKVLVLERRYVVGGACVTEETFPGLQGLDRGLRQQPLPPGDHPRSAPARLRLRGDRTQSGLVLAVPRRTLSDAGNRHRAQDVEEIAKFSQRDAENYPKYEAMLERVASVVEPTLTQVPPNLVHPTPGQLLEAGKMGTRAAAARPGDGRGDRSAHRRGAPDPRSLVRVGRAERHDRDRRDHRRVHGAVDARERPTCSSITSWARPTASAAFGVTCAAAWAASRKRSRAPPKDLGVEIRTEAEVAQASLTHSGRVTGVALTNGDEFAAKRVASGVDCHLTFEKLLDPAALPPAFRDAVARISYSSASCKINVALERLPSFTALPGHEPGPQHFGTVHLCPDQDFIERALRRRQVRRRSRASRSSSARCRRRSTRPSRRRASI